MNDLKIAETIWEQMKILDRNLIMCMGVTKKLATKSGLRFNVNGLAFKGVVQITLNGKDLYDVKLLKSVRNYFVNELYGKKQYTTNLETFCEMGDVYAEDLMSILELKVEGR